MFGNVLGQPNGRRLTKLTIIALLMIGLCQGCTSSRDRCAYCHGKGKVRCISCDGYGVIGDGSYTDPICNGTGAQSCPACGGTGKAPRRRY